MVTVGKNKKILDIIYTYGKDILESDLFLRERDYIQHGDTTTYTHSLCVTYISVALAIKKKKKVDMRSLIRGALLHDYFLYDWHEKNEFHRLHGYTHAKRSMENAIRDFDLNEKEAGIIYSHMFPLNLTHLPKSKEARIVCLADKICAGYETLSLLDYTDDLK